MKPVRHLGATTPGLADYGETEREHPNWEGFRSHRAGAALAELRDVLVDNQHGLCAYCEIVLEPREIQIEHVVPRSAGAGGAALELDIGNLLACCLGGAKDSPRRAAFRRPIRNNLSCGEAKGNRSKTAFLDPRELPSGASLFRVDLEGMIFPDETACQRCGVSVSRVRLTIRILGLNVPRLRGARARRWSDLLASWGAYEDDPEVMATAARLVLLPDRDGRLGEFFTTARSYFRDTAETVLAEAPGEWV